MESKDFDESKTFEEILGELNNNADLSGAAFKALTEENKSFWKGDHLKVL